MTPSIEVLTGNLHS
jgi:PAS domain-containing protein